MAVEDWLGCRNRSSKIENRCFSWFWNWWFETIANTKKYFEKGVRRVSPFFIPSSLINLLSGQISIKFQFKGPNHSVVTACSTGAHSIGDAARVIVNGKRM